MNKDDVFTLFDGFSDEMIHEISLEINSFNYDESSTTIVQNSQNNPDIQPSKDTYPVPLVSQTVASVEKKPNPMSQTSDIDSGVDMSPEIDTNIPKGIIFTPEFAPNQATVDQSQLLAPTFTPEVTPTVSTPVKPVEIVTKTQKEQKNAILSDSFSTTKPVQTLLDCFVDKTPKNPTPTDPNQSLNILEHKIKQTTHTQQSQRVPVRKPYVQPTISQMVPLATIPTILMPRMEIVDQNIGHYWIGPEHLLRQMKRFSIQFQGTKALLPLKNDLVLDLNQLIELEFSCRDPSILIQKFHAHAFFSSDGFPTADRKIVSNVECVTQIQSIGPDRIVYRMDSPALHKSVRERIQKTGEPPRFALCVDLYTQTYNVTASFIWKFRVHIGSVNPEDDTVDEDGMTFYPLKNIVKQQIQKPVPKRSHDLVSNPPTGDISKQRKMDQ